MSSLAETSRSESRQPNSAKKLLHAAALAASLVPLAAVAAEPATITCVSGICSGVGSYSADTSGSNLWKFIYGGETLYTLLIEGTAANDFTLDVEDRQVPFLNLESFNIAFPDSECIPMADEDTCVIFDVFADGEPNWLGGYYLEMRWFAPDVDPGDSPMKPPDDGRNHIFKSEDGFTFDDVLADELYDPEIDPIDPALGGRGDSFTSFIGGRATVPEPATVSLLGLGIGAALYRRRRKRER